MGLSEWSKYQLKRKSQYYFHAAFNVLNLAQQIIYTGKHLEVVGANSQAFQEYSFPIYPGRAILFRTEDQYRANAVGVQYDPQFGWGDIFTDGLDIHYIPGSHLSLLEEPYIQVLAAKFKVCLEQAQALHLSGTQSLKIS
jgi:thioesterase domain-containing protein